MSAMGFILSEACKEDLAARHYPVEVIYGRERLGKRTDYCGLPVLFRRDTETSDALGAPLGAASNPPKVYTLQASHEILIYGHDTTPGTREEDHEALAEWIRDAVLVSVREWCVSQHRGEPIWTEGRFLSSDEMAKEEIAAGAVYRLKLQIRRSVRKVTWEGSGAPEAVLQKMRNRTEVRYAGASTDPPTVGCDNTD
jgi:hypothetical protein